MRPYRALRVSRDHERPVNFQVLDHARFRPFEQRVNRESLFDETGSREHDRVFDDVAIQVAEMARTEFALPSGSRAGDAHDEERMVPSTKPVGKRSRRFRKPQPLALPGIRWKLHTA